MLHLENFFEKSFALLLTTPNELRNTQIILTFLKIRDMISKCAIPKGRRETELDRRLNRCRLVISHCGTHF